MDCARFVRFAGFHGERTSVFFGERASFLGVRVTTWDGARVVMAIGRPPLFYTKVFTSKVRKYSHINAEGCTSFRARFFGVSFPAGGGGNCFFSDAGGLISRVSAKKKVGCFFFVFFGVFVLCGGFFSFFFAH